MKRNLIGLFLYISFAVSIFMIICPSANAVTYTKVSIGGTAGASSQSSSSYSAAKAFDGSTSTAWYSSGYAVQYYCSSCNTPQYLWYKLPSPQAVNAYGIRPMSYPPASWRFQGYNGSSWVTLDTRTNIGNWSPGVRKPFYFSNTTKYQYYRLYIIALYPSYSYPYFYNYVGIGELELYAAVPPSISSFTASHASIDIGSASKLTWSTTNATSANIDKVGSVATSDSIWVSPIVNTTYKLTAVGPGGTATKTVSIKIFSPVASITSNSSAIISGDSLTIGWASTNVTSVTIDNGIGSVYSNSSGIASTNGTVVVYPTTTTTTTKTYTITAQGPGGTDTASVAVTVYPDTTDSDGDGLPDWYEVYTYEDLTSHGISDGSCDCE